MGLKAMLHHPSCTQTPPLFAVCCLLCLLFAQADFSEDVASMLSESEPKTAAVVQPALHQPASACASKEAIKCAGCKNLLTGKLPAGLTMQFCFSVCPKYISCVKKSTIEK